MLLSARHFFMALYCSHPQRQVWRLSIPYLLRATFAKPMCAQPTPDWIRPTLISSGPGEPCPNSLSFVALSDVLTISGPFLGPKASRYLP